MCAYERVKKLVWPQSYDSNHLIGWRNANFSIFWSNQSVLVNHTVSNEQYRFFKLNSIRIFNLLKRKNFHPTAVSKLFLWIFFVTHIDACFSWSAITNLSRHSYKINTNSLHTWLPFIKTQKSEVKYNKLWTFVINKKMLILLKLDIPVSSNSQRKCWVMIKI